MHDAVEEVTCVLDHRDVHLHLDLDGAAIDVVRIGAAIGFCLREFALLALALVIVDDPLEALTFLLELPLESCER